MQSWLHGLTHLLFCSSAVQVSSRCTHSSACLRAKACRFIVCMQVVTDSRVFHMHASCALPFSPSGSVSAHRDTRTSKHAILLHHACVSVSPPSSPFIALLTPSSFSRPCLPTSLLSFSFHHLPSLPLHHLSFLHPLLLPSFLLSSCTAIITVTRHGVSHHSLSRHTCANSQSL